MTPLRTRVLALARQIPAGRVTTYGTLARLAGSPRSAREVGRAMATLSPEDGVPWWRVVGAGGRISLGPPCAAEQAARLREEGIPVTPDGTLPLARCLWEGEDAA